MFKNLPSKILALILAAIFWIFVVSFENTFYKLPEDVPITVFNQSQDLALASELGHVRLILRTEDSVVLKTISASDFEAYIDLKNAGAGFSRASVSVTSKNPRVSVLKIEPGEIEIELEPIRQKTVSLASDVKGQVAKGFRLDSVKLTNANISISGAESLLKRIVSAKAEIILDGTENKTLIKKTVIKIYDNEGKILEGLKVEQKEVLATFNIIETENSKQIGIKAKFSGTAPGGGVVKNVEIEPSVVSINGLKTVLDAVEAIETEPIDLKNAEKSFEKKVKLVLPQGVSLAGNEASEAVVKVQIEQQPSAN